MSPIELNVKQASSQEEESKSDPELQGLNEVSLGAPEATNANSQLFKGDEYGNQMRSNNFFTIDEAEEERKSDNLNMSVHVMDQSPLIEQLEVALQIEEGKKRKQWKKRQSHVDMRKTIDNQSLTVPRLRVTGEKKLMLDETDSSHIKKRSSSENRGEQSIECENDQFPIELQNIGAVSQAIPAAQNILN